MNLFFLIVNWIFSAVFVEKNPKAQFRFKLKFFTANDNNLVFIYMKFISYVTRYI